MSKFDEIIEMVLEHEGGYVNHSSDPGGETIYGISKRAYPDLDIKNLTVAEAKEIYRNDYWNRIKGEELPVGVACVVLDYSVNSGTSRASKALQSVCGIANGDGIIGPASLNSVWTTVKNTSEQDVINAVTEQRQGFIRALSIYDTFGKGWERRIEETRAKAMELI